MKSIKYIILAWVLFVLGACRKSDFLNARPDNSLVVPANISDFQALLDNDIIINGAGNNGIVPALGEAGADDHYLTDDYFNSGDFSVQEKNEYLWAKDPYPGIGMEDWDWPYRAAFYANVVLEGLSRIPATQESNEVWNNVEGTALFIRAFNFYQLAQVFAVPYDSVSSENDIGIPLRLSSDINEKIKRSTLQQTYTQIISDLQKAVQFLPVKALYPTRPSKEAAYGLLSRVYQTMEDYNKSLLYADSCLNLKPDLMDYNELNPNDRYPVSHDNIENMFSCTLIRNLPVLFAIADTDLYKSYDDNDLRKSVFFKPYDGAPYFYGSYDGSGNLYSGIATDEIYLIRAECYAREGKTLKAMNDLNTLLIKRYKSGTFLPLTATNANDALRLILEERRKELLLRGLRWTDLRRLNKDPDFAITLTRVINGQIYTLPPNDPRYVYPIPDDIISFNPGMKQNIR